MTMRLIFRAFVEWATFLKEFALLGKVWVEACAGRHSQLPWCGSGSRCSRHSRSSRSSRSARSS